MLSFIRTFLGKVRCNHRAAAGRGLPALPGIRYQPSLSAASLYSASDTASTRPSTQWRALLECHGIAMANKMANKP
jgi:hypothetical protein